MANVGEAQVTRLTRERFAATKKFLPVRDEFRDDLQGRQQQKIDFTADTEQLFKPITAATKKVVTATEKVGTTTAKDWHRNGKYSKKNPRKIREKLKILPGDEVAAQTISFVVSHKPIPEQLGKGTIIQPNEVFSATTLNEIKDISSDVELARYAFETSEKRKDILN